MTPRVYLAGKIGHDDWRQRIIPGLRDHTWHDGPIDVGPYSYVGPFFVGCDHGCFHGANRHGMLNKEIDACPDAYFTRQEVIDLNMKAIDDANLLFAYITAPDCYGTIFELGYSVRKNKRVVVCFAPGISHADFWFSSDQADHVHYGIGEELLPGLLKAEVSNCIASLRADGIAE